MKKRQISGSHFAGVHIARRERPHKLFERTAAVVLLLLVHSALLVLFNLKITTGTAPPIREITLSLLRSLPARRRLRRSNRLSKSRKVRLLCPASRQFFPHRRLGRPRLHSPGSRVWESPCSTAISGIREMCRPRSARQCRHLSAPRSGTAEIGMPRRRERCRAPAGQRLWRHGARLPGFRASACSRSSKVVVRGRRRPWPP